MLSIQTRLLIAATLTSILSCETSDDLPPDQQPIVEEFAANLVAPLGIETDADGQVWVTEAGTGTTNDGQLSVITADGTVHTVASGFVSAVSPEGGIFGLNHIVLHGDTLFLLHGIEGKLYKMDVSGYTLGDTPLDAGDLLYEDIGSFVLAYDFEEDTGETDLFSPTVGPGGDLYLLDAGANAIIHRTTTGELSVFATIPPVTTTLEDFPMVEAVPTGIAFDGEQFLVATFTGFPFPVEQAVIYAIDMQGNTSVYQTGLSCLTDIEIDGNGEPIVVEFGTWTGESFTENSGQLVHATQTEVTPLVTDLNFPNSLEKGDGDIYYVAKTFEGLILKVSL